MTTLKESQDSIQPVANAFEITPSDLDELLYKTRGLLVSTAGNVDITTGGGQRVTIALVAGVIHPLVAIKVWATGTTATGIVGFY